MSTDPPDVYFTDGYVAAAALMEGDSWRILATETRGLLLPVVLRSPEAVSPYGYSGLYVRPGTTPRELASFWSEALAQLREMGVVSLFLRFSPFDLGSVAAARQLGLDLTRRGDTVIITVGAGPDPLWSGLHSTARNRVRKAQRVGLTARVRPICPDMDVAPDSPFRRLYNETMTRVRAAHKYHFDDLYYKTLAEALGSGLWIAEALDATGNVVAGALLMTYRDRVHYHLGASDRQFALHGCNNLLFWTFLRWADERGMRHVHLGGGLAPGDSLSHFKRTFGGAVGQFWTGQVVVDADRYEFLLAERAASLGLPVAALESSGYFPAYRGGAQ